MRFDDQGLEIEELIAAVARRHKALLSADDPIFMTVTLHELLLDRALKKLAASVAASQDQLAAGTTQYLAASQALGERLVTEATKHLLGQLREASAAAGEAVKAAAAAEIRNLQKASERGSVARQSAWWAAALCLIAAAITATLAVVFPLIDPKPPACRPTHQPELSAAQQR
jgi:hypothetical protein